MQKTNNLTVLFFIVVSLQAGLNPLYAAETWTASQNTPTDAVKTYFYAYAQQRLDLTHDSITDRYAEMIGVGPRPKTKPGETDEFEIPEDIELTIVGVYRLTKGAESAGYDAIVIYDFTTQDHSLQNLVAPVALEAKAWKVTIPNPDDESFLKLKPGIASAQKVLDILEASGDLKFEKMS